jgi:hypothetical protein
MQNTPPWWTTASFECKNRKLRSRGRGTAKGVQKHGRSDTINTPEYTRSYMIHVSIPAEQLSTWGKTRCSFILSASTRVDARSLNEPSASRLLCAHSTVRLHYVATQPCRSWKSSRQHVVTWSRRLQTTGSHNRRFSHLEVRGPIRVLVRMRN